jgi:hypothetical protein
MDIQHGASTRFLRDGNKGLRIGSSTSGGGGEATRRPASAWCSGCQCHPQAPARAAGGQVSVPQRNSFRFRAWQNLRHRNVGAAALETTMWWWPGQAVIGAAAWLCRLSAASLAWSSVADGPQLES